MDHAVYGWLRGLSACIERSLLVILFSYVYVCYYMCTCVIILNLDWIRTKIAFNVCDWDVGLCIFIHRVSACNFVMPLIARHFDLATPPVHIYNLQTSSIASYHTISFVYVSYLLIPCTLNSNTSSSLPILTNFTPLLTLVVLIYFIELSLFHSTYPPGGKH